MRVQVQVTGCVTRLLQPRSGPLRYRYRSYVHHHATPFLSQLPPDCGADCSSPPPLLLCSPTHCSLGSSWSLTGNSPSFFQHPSPSLQSRARQRATAPLLAVTFAMAVKAVVPFLVAMMLLTGVCNTLLTKYQVL